MSSSYTMIFALTNAAQLVWALCLQILEIIYIQSGFTPSSQALVPIMWGWICFVSPHRSSIFILFEDPCISWFKRVFHLICVVNLSIHFIFSMYFILYQTQDTLVREWYLGAQGNFSIFRIVFQRSRQCRFEFRKYF